jgi:hypothetical protein
MRYITKCYHYKYLEKKRSYFEKGLILSKIKLFRAKNKHSENVSFN